MQHSSFLERVAAYPATPTETSKDVGESSSELFLDLWLTTLERKQPTLKETSFRRLLSTHKAAPISQSINHIKMFQI
jgi:hypothetical protein